MDTGWKSSRKLAQQKGLPADAQTSHHLGLVPDADLPQLNAGMEHACQVLDQLPEVHPLVRGEIEEDLAAVKGAFGADQLHIQPMGLDFLDADALGLGLSGPVLRHNALILGACPAQHLPQGRYHILLPDAVNAAGADAVFLPPGRVDDDMVPLGEGDAVRVEEIDLLSRPELNIHNGDQLRGIGFFHDKLLTFINNRFLAPLQGELARRSRD